MIKNYVISFLILIFLLVPGGIAHALPFNIGSGVGGCGPASVTQGALNKARQGITSRLGGLFGGGGGIAGGLLGGKAVPIEEVGQVLKNSDTLVAKDCVGDPLTVALREVMIATLTRSIIDWANNGFEGAPVYVTDLGRLLQETGDSAARDFIYGSNGLGGTHTTIGGGFGNVCSPYQQDVRRIIAERYSRSQPAAFQQNISCSFDPSLGNLDAFLGGDFSQGGWRAFWHVTTRDNIFRSLSLAENELGRRVEEEKEEIKSDVQSSDGFLSKAGCDFVQGATQNPILLHVNDPNSAGGTDGGFRAFNTKTRSGCHAAGGVWNKTTPGSIIKDTVSDVTGSGLDRLETADEIDEIINILLAQLAQKALTGIGGFRGLSSQSSGSSFTTPGGQTQSYVEAIVNETTNESIDGAQNVLLLNIESAINLEESFKIELELLIGVVTAADTNLYACYINLIEEPRESNKEDQLEIYETELSVSDRALSSLEQVYEQASRAITADSLNRAADAYDAVIAADIIHNAADIEAVQNERISFSSVVENQEEVCGVETI